MEIDSISNVSRMYRTSGVPLSQSPQTGGLKKGASTTQMVRKASRTPDYTVNISTIGRNRSVSDFDRTQRNEKTLFDRKQDNEINQKTRELENEKNNFERKQATEERSFETKQRMERQRFIQQQNRTNR